MLITHFINSIDPEILIRVIVSITLGFLIGLEREFANKSAGLRTHILVCLGSTVFTYLSIHGFVVHSVLSDGTRIQNDPARIAAQILTGIGFIGGGAVLHHGVSVYGLTTAASLWISASIGMAVGSGSYELATVTTIFSLLILVAIRKLEMGILSKHTKRGARIKAKVICANEHVSEVQDWFYREFQNISEMTVSKSAREDDLIKITFTLDMFEVDPIGQVYKRLKDLKNIESITLQQILDDT